MNSRITLSLVLALFLNQGALAQSEMANPNPTAIADSQDTISSNQTPLSLYQLREQELMKEQKEVNEQWMDFVKEKETRLQQMQFAADHEITDKFTLKKRLASMVDQFKSKDAMKEIWGDYSTYTDTVPQNIFIHFDTVNQVVDLKSEDLDAKGRPILEYAMNKKTGHTIETKRLKDGTETHKREKDIEINSLSNEIKSSFTPAIDHGNENTSPTPNQFEQKDLDNIKDEWNDLEKQRDLAFKIMYFFVVFMIGTFGLIYAFFKLTQSEEHQAAIQKQKKLREASIESGQDFLNMPGPIDEEGTMINPYQRKLPTMVSGQFTSSSAPFANLAAISLAKAQQLKESSKSSSYANSLNTSMSTHRDNQGFGTSNLEHLNSQENRQNAQNYAADFQLLNSLYGSNASKY